MSGIPAFKLSNVIGSPFKDYVQTQLQTRVRRSTTIDRSPTEVLYLANKTAWVKLSSSVNVGKEYLEKLQRYYTAADGFNKNAAIDDNLARNWVLQAGTSKQAAAAGNNAEQIKLRFGFGLDNAYGLGGVEAQGFRPMPGLDSVTIESAGKLGSLRYANITFKVWNMNQLDVIDALYFRLGYTMLLEWGHVHYYTNDTPNSSGPSGTYQTSEGGVDGFFGPTGGTVIKEELLRKINARIIETDGNYDGMLGVVTNFNYSFNQEGGWDCSIKLLGLGSVVETQKVNSSYKMPPWSKDIWDKYVKKIEQVILARKQKVLDDADRDAYLVELSNYNRSVAAYNSAFPLSNLSDFFKKLRNDQNIVLDFNNPDHVKDLWQTSVVFPSDPYQKTGTELIGTNNTIRTDITVVTNTQSNAMGFTLNSQVYLPHIIEGPDGTLTGFKKPLQQGNTYTLKSNFLDFIAASINWAQDRNAGGPGVFDPPLNLNSPFRAVKNSGTSISKPVANAAKTNLFSKGYTLGGDPIPKGQPGAGGYTPAYYSIDLTSGGLTGDFIPNVLFPTHNYKVYFGVTGGRRGEYSATSLSGNSKEPNQILEFAISVNTTPVSQATLNDPVYHFVKQDDVVDLLNSPATATELSRTDRVWTVEELKIEKLSKSNFTPTLDGAAAQGPSLAVIVLATTIRVKVPVRDAKYNLISPAKEEELDVSVRIKTSLLAILKKLMSYAGGGPSAPGSAPKQTKRTATLNQAEKDQINKVGGLGSALESMLSIVQYSGVALAIGNKVAKNELKKIDIQPYVSDFIRALNTAPMNKLFKDDGTLKTEKELDDEIKQQTAEVLLTHPYFLGLKGYNAQLMSYNKNKELKEGEFYNKYPIVEFEKIFQAYVLGKEFYTSGTDVEDSLSVLQTPVYVKLGFLLFFMDNMCLLYDSTKKATVKNNEAARPHFYIDYHPATNYCLTVPAHLSTDPTTCLIPFKGDGQDYYNMIKQGTSEAPPTGSYQLFANDTTTKELVKNFLGDNPYQAKPMEILINVQYLLDVIRETVDRDNHNDVYLRPLVDRILSDLNKATGDINAFRFGYIDAGNVATVLDDQFVPPDPLEKDDNLLVQDAFQRSGRGTPVLPLFGAASLARDLTFETNITTKMSSMIAISARGQHNSGSTQSTDGSNLYWLSEGLFDRVVEEAEDVSKGKNAKSVGNNTQTSRIQGKDDRQELISLFHKHVKSIYTAASSRIDRGAIQPARNYYIQALTKSKAIDKVTKGAPIIPMNASFTTDGIAGISMGNVFLIPQDKLPISLRGDFGEHRFGYMVMGLTHAIQNNQWTTSVKGQIIKLRDAETTKPIPEITSTSYVEDLSKLAPVYEQDDDPNVGGASLQPDSDPGKQAIVPPEAASIPDSRVDIVKRKDGKPFNTLEGPEMEMAQINGKLVGTGIIKPLLAMIDAAKKDGITIRVSSGFRDDQNPIDEVSQKGVNVTSSSQLSLYNAYINGTGNLAATPKCKGGDGSNHSRSKAVDLNVGTRVPCNKAGALNRDLFQWLISNAYKFGFVRTVAKEEWHWEYRPGSYQYSQRVPRNNIACGCSPRKCINVYEGFTLD